MSFARVLEGLNAQLAGHLATIRELKLKIADLEKDNERLAGEVEKLKRDNRWLEDRFFDGKEM